MCTNNIFNEYIACICVCDWKNIVPWIHYPLKMFIGSRFTLERFCCWMCWEEATKLSICKYINLMLMPVRRTRAWVITSEIHRNTLKRVRLRREQGPRGRKKKNPLCLSSFGKTQSIELSFCDWLSWFTLTNMLSIPWHSYCYSIFQKTSWDWEGFSTYSETYCSFLVELICLITSPPS